MNVNENVPVFGRGRSRGRQLKLVPIQRTVMGPPRRPVPRRKESSSSSHTTTNSSSNINWRSNQKSTQNNSTTIRTTCSTRSHSSTEPESRIIIALSEGRGEAAGEVGIAGINIARPSLILCQISDSQSYVNTLTKINILNPSEILIPLTFIESFTSNRLITKIKEQFRNIKITGVARSSFNKTVGLQFVKQLCVPSMNSILLILQHRYYALAAAAALLTYTETALYVCYAKESIKIEYQESEGSTIIDVATADRLELVASARPTIKKRFSCLLDVLNHCITKIGSRTLRASILQPPCSLPEIEARLDCITELLEHTEMQKAIEGVLLNLTNIDQLLTLATVLPDQAQNCSERQLNYILLLNNVLEQIIPLQDIFENSRQPFFIELVTTLSNPAFIEIKDLVRTLINTDAHPGKGESGLLQRCFAIKSGINSLLDLVRKSYSERIEDMRNYVTSFGEEHSLAFTLHNNYKKGYHILLNLNATQKKTLKRTDLPLECIQVERLANSYTMKTQYLINFSNRVEDILGEILKMSNIMIHKLLIQIRVHAGIFYKLCEDIAKLDMLQSLAKASSAMDYVRPEFADYLEVKQARHPMLDFLCSKEPTANSMYASKEYNINIITGPNGSGKSILVRQVILIQVMAQVGCYVPAQSAILRVSDRILARIYLEDNMDCGASAFVLEMKEIQYFLTVLTKNTLIIIDELCRSTSVEEGTALAMAICEKLMRSSAFLFFTTHFKFLSKLQDIHFNVKTWQLETLTEKINNQMVLHFTYNVIPGVTSLEHYGIFLAKGSWPETIIKYAEEILKRLSSSHKRPSPHIEQVSAAARLKYDLEAELQMLKAKKELTRTKINEKLIEYQRHLENLGQQVEISLVYDQINNSNGNYDSNYNIGNQNESGSLSQANSEHSLKETDQSFDYFNLKGQSEFDNNLSDISEQINRVMVNQPSTMEIFPKRDIPQVFNFEEDAYSTFLENEFSFPSHSFQTNNNQEINFQNYQRATTSAMPGNFLNYSEDLNLTTEMGEAINFSDSNIFEPEVILETNEQLFGSSKIENRSEQRFIFQKESTVGQKITFITQENIFMTSHTENLSVNQEYSYNSRENSIAFSKDGSMYEASISEWDNENWFANRGSNNYLEQSINKRNGNESFSSITEQQFSLPLQENIERTSTPLNFPQRGQPQPIPTRNQTDPLTLKSNKFNKPFFEESNFHLSHISEPIKLNPNSSHNENWRIDASLTNNNKTAKDSKSNSTKSDSIKWITPNSNNFAIPSIPTPRSNSKGTNMNGSLQTRNDIQNKQSSTLSNNTDSIIWNVEKNKTNDVSKSMSDSRYYSESDVTEALNDLQNCSEYFFESEDWDFVDGKINSKQTLDDKEIKKTKESEKITEKLDQNLLASFKEKSHQTFHSSKSSTSETAFLSEKTQQCKEDSFFKKCEEVNKTQRSQIGANSTEHREEISQIPYYENIHPSPYNIQTPEKSKCIEKPHIVVQDGKDSQFDWEMYSLPFLDDIEETSKLSWEEKSFHKQKSRESIQHPEEISKIPYRRPSQYDIQTPEESKSVKKYKQSRYGNGSQLNVEIHNLPSLEDIEETFQSSWQEKSFHKQSHEELNKTQTSQIDPQQSRESIQHTEGISKIPYLHPSHHDVQTPEEPKCVKKSNPSRYGNGAQLNVEIHNLPSLEDIEETFQLSWEEKSFHKECNEEVKETETAHIDANSPEHREEISQIPDYEDIHSSPYNIQTSEESKCIEKPQKVQYGKDSQFDWEMYSLSSLDDIEETSKLSWIEKSFPKQCHVELDKTQTSKIDPQKSRESIQHAEEISKIPYRRPSQFDIQTPEEPKCVKKSKQTQYGSGSQLNLPSQEDIEETFQLSWDEKSFHKQCTNEDVNETQKTEIAPDTEMSYHEDILPSNCDFPIPPIYIEQPHQLQHKKDSQFNKPTSQEGLEKTSQFQDFPEITGKNEDHFPTQWGLSKIDGVSNKTNDNSQCGKKGNEPENGCDYGQEDKSSETGGNRNEDCNVSENMEALNQIKNKSLNESNIEILGKGNGEEKENKTVEQKYVPAQNSSLEPLGDIHLELFSDESFNKENPSPGIQVNLLSTKEIPLVDDDNSKTRLDCKKSPVQKQSKLSLLCPKNLNMTLDEYETAYASLISSEDGSVFFNTPCSFEPEFTSTQITKQKEDGKSFPQNPKRRRLGGYVYKPIFTKDSSPDIFEDALQDLNPLNKDENTSLTPSDFEITKNTKLMEKSRQVYPLVEDQMKSKKKTKSKIPKFKPPQKLTKKEIERDFYEQDKKMLESEDNSKYLEQIMNRPTVKQLQQIKHIALIHKTNTGVMVVPAKNSKPRKRKFVTPLKRKSEDFDVTLFCDKNSNKFEQFMNNSNNNKKVVNVRQDIANQFLESEVVSKIDNKENMVNEGSVGVLKNTQNKKIKILQNITLGPTFSGTVQKTKIVKDPKQGFCTPNTKRLDDIIQKYLKPEIKIANRGGSNKNSQELNSTIFDHSTVVLEISSD